MSGGLPFSIQSLNSLIYGGASSYARTQWLRQPVRFLARNTHYVAPRRHTQTGAVHGNDAIKSGVSILLLLSFPSAVFWRIWSVIIDSSDRMYVGWPWSHIREKILKTVSPSIAYRDASSSVMLVNRVIRVETTHLHVSPSLIFWRSGHAVLRLSPVLFKRFCRSLSLQAPATEYKFSKMGCWHKRVLSAVTQAIPHRVTSAMDRWHLCKNSKSPKLLTRNIGYAAHYVSPLNTYNMQQVGI